MEQKPTPIPRREFTHKLIEPYLGDGKPPIPKELNRGEQISMRGDKNKIITIGLEDNDKAVLYYFENVIKPNIIMNNQRIAVPVVISSPEKFKSVQRDGFYRDKNGKVMCPLLTFKRESFEKNRSLGNKLDGNFPQNVQLLEQQYNKRNVYDNFSALQNTKPQISRIITVIPDYITITYSCVLFTNYVEQNNKIIEAVQFTSDSYWGDISQFQFRARIDSFTTATILEQDEDRIVKSSFNIILNGYLIPDSVNKDIAVVQNKIFDKTKIVFTAETVGKLPK